MRKVISDLLKNVVKYLKEDFARFISMFLIVGVGFTLVAYLLEGESAFERVFSALISDDPLYKKILYGSFFVGASFEVLMSFLRSHFNWHLDFWVTVAHQIRGLFESVALLLAGTCITGSLVIYNNPTLGKAGVMLGYSFFFLIFYAIVLCATEYIKNELSSMKPSGGRMVTKENKQH
ncbi:MULTISPECIES: hypothetical protein [Pectobacterium]|uniref:hypothetical protein n=1 Tax=Pectobacterium TaxID=122277 RepID=UPI00102E5A4D|nr:MULTISPECIES: hypothetical protein [Pectobacterium]MBQ4775296.1 hypothetical protein [Pectobacterium versatile]TAI86948.1 hypothetical protein EG330_06105 [Pectobacterium versatile]